MDPQYTIDNLLGTSFVCDCGREHSTCFSELILEEDALQKLPSLLKEYGYQYPYLICDTNTYRVCGQTVCSILDTAQVCYEKIILQSPAEGDLPADEESFGRVCMAFPKESDVVISIGAGTINDLGRYLSYITGREFLLVLTAPSMDGCVSGVAPLIQNHLKITFPAHAPLALIGDLKILSEAPMKMLSAGVGDILGKYNCLTDWKLSALVNQEYYCGTIEGIMRSAIDKTMEAARHLKERRPEDIRTLTEGLVLSGIAMDFAGNSRPASGAEHHLSHFFEMQFLFDGIPAVLHGTKVGIGTVITLGFYNQLANMERPDFDLLRKKAAERPDFETWTKEMKRAYRDGAPMVIELEKKAKKNDLVKLLQRLDQIEAHWDEIQALASSVPKAEEIAGILKSLDAPITPGEVGVCREYVADGILYAKELRDRYTILQLLWDIDKLTQMEESVIK
ncbi:MAG: sn-glycerol-1-phosphate dehydrogenase [Lachnospiraceae bacterium]|nr:sn-glycerol-1-phosphate dehydrogenase [Lachnospiraceae bacterium]